MNYRYQHGNHVIFTSPNKVYPLLKELKEKWNFILLLDICGVDNLKYANQDLPGPKRFECVYHLLNMGEHQRLRLRVPLDLSETLPSIVNLWKSADWFEKEAWDMFGFTFKNKKKERLLTHAEFVGHPLRKDYQHKSRQKCSGQTRSTKKSYQSITIEPASLHTKGTVRVNLELDGETIQKSNPEIGYLHRCFEKICEGLLYNQIVPYTDRLNYCSAPLNTIGWCKAVEDFMGIDIPDRAKVSRMIIAELARILDHLQCLSSATVEMEVLPTFWIDPNLPESIYKLFEQLCGSRITPSISRIGGMAYDLSPEWARLCYKTARYIKKNVDELQSNLLRSSIWVKRTQVCPISASDAIEWGHTGPCLRACGVNYDLRKTTPYYFYNDIEFEIPLGISGNSYDRYLVRFEEIRQSLNIIFQLLNNIPSGPILVDDEKTALPDKKSVYKNLKSFTQHFDFIDHGLRPPKGEIYSAIEAANGELGFYFISDGTQYPYRVKVRPPCFPIFQSFPSIVHGSSLANASLTLNSLNIIPGELDR